MFLMDNIYKRAGFTLLEISIGLVIIGLLIGGVLVGRDMIASAALRAQLSQIEKLKAATMTFKLKFGSLPGDMSSSNAAAFGISPGWGNENGFIDGEASNANFEPYLFFHQLQQANLFPCDSGNCKTSWDYLTMSQYDAIFVPSRITSSGILQVYGGPVPAGFGGLVANLYKNYIEICSSAMLPSAARPITPFQGFALDSKIDDGLPLTGVVMAMGTCYQNNHPDWWNAAQHLSPSSGAAGSANCVSINITPNGYNVQNASLTCGIRFNADF